MSYKFDKDMPLGTFNVRGGPTKAIIFVGPSAIEITPQIKEDHVIKITRKELEKFLALMEANT